MQKDFSRQILENYKYLSKNYKDLQIFLSMEEHEFSFYSKNARGCQQAMNELDYIFDKLSISKHISSTSEVIANSLFEILNSCFWLWKDDDDCENLNLSFRESYIVDYYPSGLLFADSDQADDILILNKKIEKLCSDYLTFTEDILRVEYLYRKFVDEYLHSSNKFLDSEALGNVFVQFLNDTEKEYYQSYMNFQSGNSRLLHEVIHIDGKNVLCEAYHFQSLGAFLYFDLFCGVYANYLPKKCENCNQYFLMKSGKYTNYCQRPLAGDETKTYRDVGSKKRYKEKCKTDPIWQTYNRSYKAHYARYMKKKMTVGEFDGDIYVALWSTVRY